MKKDISGSAWSATKAVNGLRSVTCDSWAGYVEFVNGKLLDYHNYIFRGHASETWKLEPTLDRLIRENGCQDNSEIRKKHHDCFSYASRGRRGSAPKPLEDENERWALGQHHGLATPLLDWTESPYVAAYFAFSSAYTEHDSKNRVIYALQRVSVELLLEHMRKSAKKPDMSKIEISFVRPMSDDNPD